jgi:PHD/YefM family antitoxin component YafN of YafNO toxin-antitoxin module
MPNPVEINPKNTYIMYNMEASMRQFSSLDLQQQSGEIQRSAAASPVVILNHGKPRSVMMSVEEFRRLKLAADEALPSEVTKPRPVVRRRQLTDPLGYVTTDLRQVAIAMADAAESGRNRDAVRAEIRAVERRLGMS